MAETTRRRFLGRTGSLALAYALAGCGIEGTLERARKEATPIPEITHPKVPIGNWTFSNWPLYIDKKVLKTFDKRYGGHVFQFNVSNALGTTMRQVARGGQGYDDWFVGFNLSRRFF